MDNLHGGENHDVDIALGPYRRDTNIRKNIIDRITNPKLKNRPQSVNRSYNQILYPVNLAKQFLPHMKKGTSLRELYDRLRRRLIGFGGIVRRPYFANYLRLLIAQFMASSEVSLNHPRLLNWWTRKRLRAIIKGIHPH